MSDVMVRLLMAQLDDDGETWYSGGWQTGARDPGGDRCVGVCLTPKGRRPSTAESRAAFRSNVDAVSLDARWFIDNPLYTPDFEPADD